MILWVGWIGFNGGSTTAGTEAFAEIVMNTMVAGACGGCVAMFFGLARDGLFRPEASINGVLAGLVGITAGCDAVDAQGAAVIGATTAFVAFAFARILEHVLKLDDPIGVVSVHGVGGAWGTVMVGVMARPDMLLAGSWSEQIIAQFYGVGVVFLWAFVPTLAFLSSSAG